MNRIRSAALSLALMAAASPATIPTVTQAQVFIGVSVPNAPPPLPVYIQPPLPGPNYIWTPGYWSWDRRRGLGYQDDARIVKGLHCRIGRRGLDLQRRRVIRQRLGATRRAIQFTAWRGRLEWILKVSLGRRTLDGFWDIV
jgi:hypothetical protein